MLAGTSGCMSNVSAVSRGTFPILILDTSKMTPHDAASEIDAKAVGPHFDEAKHYMDQNMWIEAIAEYDKVPEQDPDNIAVHNNKGVCLANLNRYDDALAELDKAIKLKPDYDKANINKVSILVYTGHKKVALSVANSYVDKTSPTDANTYDELVNNLCYLGRYEDALIMAGKGLELYPTESSLNNMKGVSLRYLGRYEESLAAHDKAIELSPKGSPAVCNKGYSLIELGRYDEAVKQFESALKADPKGVRELTGRGYALVHLGKYDEAISEFDKALKSAKGDRDALFCKAEALMYRKKPGDLKKAKKIFDGLIKENYKDVVAAYSYAVMNRKPELLAAIKELVDADPTLKLEFKNDKEFDRYREDPEFRRIVGE